MSFAQHSSLTTAVIGAGITGARIAGSLAAAGQSVLVFDKGRGPGGRLSVRRTGCGDFAHACPLPPIEHTLAAAVPTLPGFEQDDGLVSAEDDARVRALPRHLLGSAEARFAAQVARIERIDAGWRLRDDTGAVLGEAQRLVLTAPAPLSAALLADIQPEWSRCLQAVGFRPNWSVLLALPEGASEPEWDAAFPWLARVESQLPQVSADPAAAPVQRWVARLSDVASREALEAEPQQVVDALLARLGAAGLPWVHAAAHRWRYARVIEPLPEPAFYSDTLQLAVCGDAFAAGAADSDLGRCLVSAQALLTRWLPAP
jgi:predicted NAD/FAD-dependent oxidoreductase